MDNSSLSDPAAFAYSDFAAFRYPLTANRHVDVFICVAMVLNQDGRFQNNIAIDLYAILGRHETTWTDYGAIVDDQDWITLFLEGRLYAKNCVFVYNHGRSQFDSVGVGSGQIGPKMNG
jgi:hypothetical protein